MKSIHTREDMMVKSLRALHVVALLIAAALVLTAPSGAAAAETVDEYIAEARPYLHLSCEGAWESVNEDGKAYIDVVNKLAAIPFINYDFDVKTLESLPKEDLEKRRVEYYNEIGKMCRENPQRLLAGVIETALVDSFATLAESGK